MLKWSFLLLCLLSALAVRASWPPGPEETQPLPARLWTVAQSAWTGKVPEDVIARRDRDDEEVGVVRLTDTNYGPLVEHGPEDILWVVMVHEERVTPAAKPFFDSHTNGTRIYRNLSANLTTASPDGLSREANGKKVIWARMDYNAEWKTCTRWLIFKPPRLVLITDQGRSLRFLSPTEIRPIGEGWAKYIKQGDWTELVPWTSSFGPGGERAWLVERYISFFESTTGFRSVPAVVWMFISGVLGKILLEWMWTSGSRAPTESSGSSARRPSAPSSATTTATAPTAPTVRATRAKGKGANKAQ
ncbi:hypothetical protein DB88DRAFT_500282 [Papiliotrema laurentii]|uniref:Uncharacterized protein n=1 Tax=Papiliotrema laurentii TaxID=5418 RepID=A0AAD9CVD4_PAPLA|nr:hypothetical protein DB88DRAFT_500282 [Papiliotrema laurentii]